MLYRCWYGKEAVAGADNEAYDVGDDDEDAGEMKMIKCNHGYCYSNAISTMFLRIL